MPYKDENVRREKDRELKAKRIEYLKNNNLCIQCKQPIEEDRIGKKTCLKCTKLRSQSITEARNFFKSIGICPRCQKNKLTGKEKSCVECRAKSAEYRAKKRDDPETRKSINAAYNEWSRKHYQELKEKGICTRCGKKPSDSGRSTCNWCRAKINNYRLEKKLQEGTLKQKRMENGLCIWCENPVMQGYIICEKHHQMQVDKANMVDRSKMDRFHIKYREVGV